MKKYFLDAALLVIFLLAMSFHFLPRILHEIFGIVMLVLVAWHLWLNRRWLLNLARGKLPLRKIFSALINFSMLASLLITLVTGIFMSNYIFSDLIPLDLRRNITVHQLHVSAPYWLMILIGLHVGLNLQEIFQRLKHSFGIKKFSTRQKFCGGIFFAGMVGLGIYGAFLNRVGDRLLMKHIFATPATEFSIGAFWILFLSTMAIYSVLSFWLDKKFLR